MVPVFWLFVPDHIWTFVLLIVRTFQVTSVQKHKATHSDCARTNTYGPAASGTKGRSLLNSHGHTNSGEACPHIIMGSNIPSKLTHSNIEPLTPTNHLRLRSHPLH
ncbi:hypothetical protein P691DRAFT_802314 [Macrolepiota fuliginosa MF-IS2]|uniref:Secreted protein n=1 Tax=Macrolepiota fuliginosa MF-IS2 TaxID=1400762 RepID=A0A9P5XDU3_9AGAR|nr:hypothetical protein P691DRAFT_802314 [Macrolepiota fuliginosa MF-IS2]